MRKNLLLLMGLIVFLLVWQVIAVSLDRAYIFPTPADTFRAVAERFTSGEIFTSILETTWKVIAALCLAILVGLPLGYLIGISPQLYDLLRPFMMFLQAVPIISWLTLVIFTWGVGWKGPIFIAFLTLFPNAAFTTARGVRNIDSNYLEMAAIYEVPKRTIFRKIYLRSLVPFIVTILDINIGQAWKVILVTEYLCGGSGLGVDILMARMNIDFASIWGMTLLAVLLGMLMERFTKWAIRKAVVTNP